MDKNIAKAIEMILRQAKTLYDNEGLGSEEEILSLLKSAQILFNCNYDDEDEEHREFNEWLFEEIGHMIDRITELHRLRLMDVLNIG